MSVSHDSHSVGKERWPRGLNIRQFEKKKDMKTDKHMSTNLAAMRHSKLQRTGNPEPTVSPEMTHYSYI